MVHIQSALVSVETKMQITIKRQFTFDAGHRVYQHESKCKNLHGHTYRMIVYLARDVDKLDSLGRVIDFSVVKERLGAWIEAHWDHGFIVANDDRESAKALSCIPRQKVYILPDNPTAENMANHILMHIAPSVLDDYPVKVIQVDLWETPNCCATVKLQ
jgi:6-pyruvoyltetrahydropterin/6-carboxytetrahydropterin synthase